MPRRSWSTAAALALAAILPALPAGAQGTPNRPELVAGIPVNYDEARTGSFTLPDPLVMLNGEPVRDPETWYNRRRPELVRLFEEHQFGATPARPADVGYEVFERGTPAMGGKAVRRQVTVHFSANRAGPKMDLLMYLPANATGPVPLLLNVSFSPNSSTVADSAVKQGEAWSGQTKQRALAPRATLTRIPIESFLDAGFGFATVYYGDIDPDFLGGIPLGVRSLFLRPGQTAFGPGEWGTISAWAWGLSRAMDYFQTDPQVDAKRVAITGASRIGKTVLWAGARDPRFAMVIASVSGEGGASLSRRNYGETIGHMVAEGRYPYQFAGNRARYAADPSTSPVDAHMLISLIAPRPLLLQTGSTDYWSDPRGEFLAAVASEPVWKLLGARGLETATEPAAGQPILNTLGYFMHEGGHGVLPADWPVYLRFMRMHFAERR